MGQEISVTDYFDSSALVKRYLAETGSVWVQARVIADLSGRNCSHSRREPTREENRHETARRTHRHRRAT